MARTSVSPLARARLVAVHQHRLHGRPRVGRTVEEVPKAIIAGVTAKLDCRRSGGAIWSAGERCLVVVHEPAWLALGLVALRCFLVSVPALAIRLRILGLVVGGEGNDETLCVVSGASRATGDLMELAGAQHATARLPSYLYSLVNTTVRIGKFTADAKGVGGPEITLSTPALGQPLDEAGDVSATCRRGAHRLRCAGGGRGRGRSPVASATAPARRPRSAIRVGTELDDGRKVVGPASTRVGLGEVDECTAAARIGCDQFLDHVVEQLAPVLVAQRHRG